MSAAAPTIYRLVRLSPAHPSWHLRAVTSVAFGLAAEADRTLCGRQLGASAITEPWTGELPAMPCTRCAPHMARLRTDGLVDVDGTCANCGMPIRWSPGGGEPYWYHGDGGLGSVWCDGPIDVDEPGRQAAPA